MLKRIYFSATDHTSNLLEVMTKIIVSDTGYDRIIDSNLNLKENRKQNFIADKEDLLLIGVPVYAGRIPNILVPYFKNMKAQGAKAIAFVTFGNRAYDDALKELCGYLVDAGIEVVAVGAFVAQHSFSTVLGAGRPDTQDLAAFESFVKAAYKKIALNSTSLNYCDIPGREPIGDYYTPKDINGNALVFKDIIPVIDETKCILCGKCIRLCPMNSLKIESSTKEHIYVKIEGACIKCCACVVHCESNAIYFDDERFIRHREALENKFGDRKISEWFI